MAFSWNKPAITTFPDFVIRILYLQLTGEVDIVVTGTPVTSAITILNCVVFNGYALANVMRPIDHPVLNLIFLKKQLSKADPLLTINSRQYLYGICVFATIKLRDASEVHPEPVV